MQSSVTVLPVNTHGPLTDLGTPKFKGRCHPFRRMRIRHAGVLGIHDGWYWTRDAPTSNDIDADNDSVMAPIPNYLLDLSKIASNALGRQAPMMASYKLHSIRIGIRPVDDVTDNEQATTFAGRHMYRLATDHMKTALQLARSTEKAHEETTTGTEAVFLSAHDRYSGFRYNWSNTPDDDMVEHATYSTQLNRPWNLEDISSMYDYMTAPSEENALFNGRAPGVCSAIWECGFAAAPFQLGTGAGGATHVGDDFKEMHVEILPLIAGNVLYSSGNEPGPVDDDYIVWIEVDFTIGGTF